MRGLTFQSWGGAQWAATGQGQVVGLRQWAGRYEASVLCPAGTGQMRGLRRANKGTEVMRHTEVKMDGSQTTTPSKLTRGRQAVTLSRL